MHRLILASTILLATAAIAHADKCVKPLFAAQFLERGNDDLDKALDAAKTDPAAKAAGITYETDTWSWGGTTTTSHYLKAAAHDALVKYVEPRLGKLSHDGAMVLVGTVVDPATGKSYARTYHLDGYNVFTATSIQSASVKGPKHDLVSLWPVAATAEALQNTLHAGRGNKLAVSIDGRVVSANVVTAVTPLEVTFPGTDAERAAAAKAFVAAFGCKP